MSCINNNNNNTSNNSNRILRVLVGNKSDKEREIPEIIGMQFAERNGFELFRETSALHLDNVDKLFNDIATILVDRKLATMNNKPTSSNIIKYNHHYSTDSDNRSNGALSLIKGFIGLNNNNRNNQNSSSVSLENKKSPSSFSSCCST